MAQNKTSTVRTRRARTRQAATIHDVAARAGVSVATVSRVINGTDRVREETSQHVLAASKALHYVPNSAARSLSNHRSHTIGVVLPDVHGEFFSEIIRGIDVAARHDGYHILVSGSHSDAREIVEVLAAMRGRVDALVLMAPDVAPESVSEALPFDLPVVLLNSTAAERHSITVDNFGGARAVMTHLTSLGHRRIAFIGGPAGNADARERLRGFRHGVRATGGEAIVVRGDFTEESGYEATRSLVDARPRPTAIFAANDSMALGAMAALAESGIRVPEDISVAGFDDVPVARYVTPQLTTVRIDIAELGRRAFRVILDALSGHAVSTAVRERIATSLVIRKSSAPVSKRNASSATSSHAGSAAEQ